ncbi:unnamed protein product [Colletotrichum noveboracense]|uniref:Uncharacterized protein n=1 Tax=Colletotrichum noveboracense TaxID=2664923 RepID=A0A9W4RVI2_9PEZI|nr:unnamed protein product [Colletotrichum noveboracense]
MPCRVFSAEEMLSYQTKIDVGISHFTNIITTEQPEQGKLVMGIWSLDDSEVPSGVRNIKCTESKTVIAGLITIEDLTTGNIYTATAGSVIWFTKGSRVRYLRVKGLCAIFTQINTTDPECDFIHPSAKL